MESFFQNNDDDLTPQNYRIKESQSQDCGTDAMKRTWAASKKNIKKMKNNKHRNILTLKSTSSAVSEMISSLNSVGAFQQQKQLAISKNMKSVMLINHCRKRERMK